MGLTYENHEAFPKFSLVVRSTSIHPGLSPEDEEVKRKLASCSSRVYFDLISSDIPGPSNVSPSWAQASRPSLPFVMKTSGEGALVVKPTREELQARVETLAKKKRSVKRKAQAPPKSNLATLGMVPRLGASSPSSITKGWGSSDQVLASGQVPPPVVKVFGVAGQKNSSSKSAEIPLVVLPIHVRSPLV